MSITRDWSRWPVVIYTFKEGPLTSADISAYLDTMNGNVERGRHVVIVDVVEGAPPAVLRAAIADWEKAHMAVLKETVLGVAFVLRNGLARGAMTAISWLRPWPYPYTYCRSLDEALATADKWLRAGGLAR